MISSQCVKTTTLCYVVTILALVFLLSCVLSKLKAADAAVYCANLLCHTYLVTGELHCQTTALCSRVLSKNRFVCIATRRTNSTILQPCIIILFFMQKLKIFFYWWLHSRSVWSKNHRLQWVRLCSRTHHQFTGTRYIWVPVHLCSV